MIFRRSIRFFYWVTTLVIMAPLANAQTGGNNTIRPSYTPRLQIEVIAEASIPGGQNRLGFGGYVKGLYRVHTSDYVTFTTGITGYRSKSSVPDEGFRLWPFLFGYRKHIHALYLEPQMGYGERGGRKDIGGDYAVISKGAFFWAIGIGYDHYKHLDIGIRYESAHSSSKNAFWPDETFHIVGLYVGFNLSK